MKDHRLQHPSVQRIARIATALDILLQEVVFIDIPHLHRWRSPVNDLFDIIPTGMHPGGSGQLWDQIALSTSVEVTLDEQLRIRHASAPAFLALKWAAYDDRGIDDPLGSHDLEDILALIAARPSISDEVSKSAKELRAYIGQQSRRLLENDSVDDLLAAHLNNAQDPAATRYRVRLRLQELSIISS